MGEEGVGPSKQLVDVDLSSSPLSPLLTRTASMPPDLPLLKSRTESIARAARGDPLTLTQIRAKLADEGHVLGTEEWSEVKGEIKAVAERVLESSPDKASAPKKTKYDRVASKNLDTFMTLIDPPGADDESNDFADDAEEDEDEDASMESPLEVDEVFTKPARTAKASSSKNKVAYKSAETISSGEEEGASVKAESSKGNSKPSSKEKEKKLKKPKVPKESKPDKPPKKAAPLKPGDAPKGSPSEETRIKALKALFTAASIPRPFTLATGAERTLTAVARIERLENLLADVGLRVGEEGKLPSLSRAKAVGEKRALEKEMKEIAGAPVVEGLRGGKKRGAAEGSGDEEVAKKPPARAFGAFLGDQSSDSD